ILRPPPRPTLFPYTTLFRSDAADPQDVDAIVGDELAGFNAVAPPDRTPVGDDGLEERVAFQHVDVEEPDHAHGLGPATIGLHDQHDLRGIAHDGVVEAGSLVPVVLEGMQEFAADHPLA